MSDHRTPVRAGEAEDGPTDPADPASLPVELTAPDLTAHRDGNTGIPHAHTRDSGRPGPHVLVTAIVHGNELCGAIALDWALRIGLAPRRGRLSMAFCNTAAFDRFDPARPVGSRYVDEDFNRVWDPEALDGPRHSVELDRARALRPLVDRADLLLDIHSMQHRTEPLAMAGPLVKGRALARAVGVPATVVADAGHAGGTRLRDYGPFGDADDPRNALLVECGQHWEAGSAVVAREVLLRFLIAAGILDAADAAGRLPDAPVPDQRVIEVTHAWTIRSDAFRFVRPFVGMEVIPAAGTVIGVDGDTPVTTPYDDCVLIMPSRRQVRGQTAVRLGRLVATGPGSRIGSDPGPLDGGRRQG